MTTRSQRTLRSGPQPAQGGFTLVEIMVGLVIGLLATMVIMQVFSVFENQKRTTTGVADTLTNGNIGLYKISRDVQDAGWGLVSLNNANSIVSPLLCAPLTIDAAFPPNQVTDLTPVSIIDGGGGLSDQIVVRYGETSAGGVPSKINGLAGNTANIDSSLGCDVGSTTLVMNGPSCTLSAVTAVQSLVPPALPGAGLGNVTLRDATNANVGATLSCLGTWHEVTFSVDAGNRLVRQDFGAGAGANGAEPIVADVVNMQAQYGISASPDSNDIVAWVDATGAFLAPSAHDRNLIKAVHVAIVARDAKGEVTNVTDACNPAAKTGLCAWADQPGSPAPPIDLTGTVGWQQYRYRVFDTIIPLRNVFWSAPYLGK